jgi:hypothetical protein
MPAAQAAVAPAVVRLVQAHPDRVLLAAWDILALISAVAVAVRVPLVLVTPRQPQTKVAVVPAAKSP